MKNDIEAKKRINVEFWKVFVTQTMWWLLGEITMIERVDIRGIKSPDCVVKIIERVVRMRPGSILEVLGDCPRLEEDVRAWCEATGKVVLSVESKGEFTKLIQLEL